MTVNGAEVQLLGPIASGGMGSISLALRTIDGVTTPVAVKRLHAHRADDPESVEAFLDEARIASHIVHPNVARLFDVDMLGDELVIVMDYVEGAPLSHLLRAARAGATTLPVGVACRILVDALTGLHAAHESKDDKGALLELVHRDVSPQNVLVGSDGVTRVTDFGIAVATGRLAMTKDEQMVKGKLHYLSPEQIYRGGVDRRTDVFAAGIVLWETLTGRRLFASGTEGETLAMILREPITPASSIRAEVPFEIDEICMHALERDAARRYSTAAEFAEALRPFAGTAQEVSEVVEKLASELLLQRRQLLASGRAPSSSRVRASWEPSTRELGPDSSSSLARRLRHGAIAGALLIGGLAGACGMKLSSASHTTALSDPIARVPASLPVAVATAEAPPAAPASPAAQGDDLEIFETASVTPAEAAKAPSKAAAAPAPKPRVARPAAKRGQKPFMPHDL